jgi:hypothetical protein
MNNTTNVFELWSQAVESSIPFWKNWGLISESQKGNLENYRTPFSEEYRKFIQLAPSSVDQTINPWSFSLIQITKQMRSTNPAMEYKILKNVAGYGSQLGTIIDFLGVLEKACLPELKKMKGSDLEAIENFRRLAKAIRNAKAAPRTDEP